MIEHKKARKEIIVGTTSIEEMAKCDLLAQSAPSVRRLLLTGNIQHEQHIISCPPFSIDSGEVEKFIFPSSKASGDFLFVLIRQSPGYWLTGSSFSNLSPSEFRGLREFVKNQSMIRVFSDKVRLVHGAT